jgi:hypothetical protein
MSFTNVTFSDLAPYICKTCSCCYNKKYVNADMLWKQNIILKFIEDKIKHENITDVLDIGAGCMNLTAYLLSKYDCAYCAVDICAVEKPRLLDMLDRAQINRNKLTYLAEDFLQLPLNHKYNIIYDVCSMIHFNPSKIRYPNDGLYDCGVKIKELLSDDGYFLFASDFTVNEENNHNGVFNQEFITMEQILYIFKSAGLVYHPEYTVDVTRDYINNNKDTLDISTVLKGWEAFDYGHRNIYDVVFMVFTKNI